MAETYALFFAIAGLCALLVGAVYISATMIALKRTDEDGRLAIKQLRSRFSDAAVFLGLISAVCAGLLLPNQLGLAVIAVVGASLIVVVSERSRIRGDRSPGGNQ